MRIQKVTLPAFLASALVNSNTSGLDDSDMRWVDIAQKYCAPGHIVDAGEPFFSWQCELPGYTLGANMAEYIVLYPTL